MAYEIKYLIEYKTEDNLNAVFEIEELDPISGTIIYLKSSSENPPIFDSIPDVEGKNAKIIGSKCTINIVGTTAEYKLTNWVTEDERKFRGTLKVDGNIVFRGWLIMDLNGTNEIFNSKLSDLRLTFTDGLNQLADREYRDATTNAKRYGKATVIDILSNIAKITGLELNLASCANFTTPTVSGRPFEKIKISQLRFFEKNGTPYNCQRVLKELCTTFFAHFYQREGSFCFVPFDQSRKSTRVFNLYDTSGAYTGNITKSGYLTVGDGGSVSLQAKLAQRNYNAPFKHTTISTNYTQGILFENMFMEYFTYGASSPIVFDFQNSVETQLNNITIDNWPSLGTVKISQFTYKDSYMKTLQGHFKETEASVRLGTFPTNNKVFVIDRSQSTTGSFLFGSKAPIKKSTIVNISTSVGHTLRGFTNSGNLFNGKYRGYSNLDLAAYIVTLQGVGVTYGLLPDGSWRIVTTGQSYRIKPANQTFIKLDGYSNDLKDFLKRADFSINSLNLDTQPAPIDGVLQIAIQHDLEGGLTPYYQFQPPNITIKELPKGIDKVFYESTITGIHTVNDSEDEVSICDNSLDLIPCSVFDFNGGETSKYSIENVLQEHLLILPLIEKAVQFSRLHLKCKVQAFSTVVQVGDVLNFNNTGFSDMNGKEFLCVGIQNRDYRRGSMELTLIEIIETANNITYDIYIYNNDIKESIRRDIAVDTGTEPTTLNAPWTWTDIKAPVFNFKSKAVMSNIVYINWISTTVASLNYGDGTVLGSTSLNSTVNHTYSDALSHYITFGTISGTAKNLTVSGIKAINVSMFTLLEYLDASVNEITSIDTSLNVNLIDLYLDNNLLSTVNLSNNTALQHLTLGSNSIASINLTNNTALQNLDLADNSLTTIDLTNNTALTNLYLDSNLLTTINLSSNTSLLQLTLQNNLFNATSVNSVLAQARILWAGAYSGKQLYINGSGNAAPTGQGITDTAYMQGLGATIVTN